MADPQNPMVVSSAPPISGLVQPGPQAASPDAAQSARLAQMDTDAAKYREMAAQPLNVAPTAGVATGPHARLMNMVSGLAMGLDAFGKSLATQGREGGASMVADQQRKTAEEQRQNVAAAQAQKDHALQNQITASNFNMEAFRIHATAASEALDQTTKRISNIGATQDVRTKALQDFVMTGDQAAYDATLAQLGGATAGPAGAAGAPAGAAPAGAAAAPTAGAPAGTAAAGAVPPVAVAQWKNSVDAAASAYPADPAIKQAQAVLADPKSTSQQMAQAANGARNRMTALDTGAKSRSEQQAADPLYKLETDPGEMTGEKAPAAVAMLSEKLKDPTLSPDQKPRVQRLLNMAQQAQKNDVAFEAAKERQKQSITDGDPKAAGALLQSGLVSPQELISSRKPQFAQQAFDEAIRLGGGTKGADGKWKGGTWSAVKAESQYEYAKNPKTQNTLNLLTTMQAPGGSIDIARKQFATIPGKVNEDTFNKIMNGTVTEVGGAPVTNFKAAMVSLADEYAQVLQGGAATETTLNQAKDLIKDSYSKSQGAGAFDVIGQDMAARQKGMVRDNPALMQMYPAVAAPAQPSGKAVSLAAAMALPGNKGKTEDQVRADITAHGHQVSP